MKYFSIIFHVLVTISACSCTFPGFFPGFSGIPLNYLESFNSPFFSVKFDQNGGVQQPNAVSSYDFPKTSVSIPLFPQSFPIALYLAGGPQNSPKIFQYNTNPFIYGGGIDTTTLQKVDLGDEKNLVELLDVDGLIPVLKLRSPDDEGDKIDGDGGSGDDSDDGSCKGDCLGDKDPKEETEPPTEEATEKDVEEVEKPEEKEKDDESVDLTSGDAEEPKAETVQ